MLVLAVHYCSLRSHCVLTSWPPAAFSLISHGRVAATFHRSIHAAHACRDSQETQLGSGEHHRLLVQAGASPQPPSPQAAASGKADLPEVGSSSSLAGRTWPYKDTAQWSSGRKGGGSGGQAGRQRRWRPHVPWGKLAVLMLLLAGATLLGLHCWLAAVRACRILQQDQRQLSSSSRFRLRTGCTASCPLPDVTALTPPPAGVVGFDILKSLAPCPSRSYWLRATAMVPVTLLTLLGVRWVCGTPGLCGGHNSHPAGCWVHRWNPCALCQSRCSLCWASGARILVCPEHHY